ncbi:MAG: ABC transporter ATP-binding protein, partial [Cyclobacteriaceae bacterium]|nr:ABC transporter ATP-binding protein [Cyclobacteriaceae bacterium]
MAIDPHIALEGRGLTLGYAQGGRRKEILQDLHFQLLTGEFTCLLGPNGVGKSSLVKSILGELLPWKGDMLLHGKALQSLDIQERAKRIAVVLAQSAYPGYMTVGQLVALGRTPYLGWGGKLQEEDRKKVHQAMEDTRISHLKDERLSELSDGQRQKAMIARALAQDGAVMVLDEPTAHLDLVNRLEIMHLLREITRTKGKAVLVVTHDLDIALETADRFWILNCGIPLLSGMPEDLVLSGQMQHLVSGQGYHFSMERGRVEWEAVDEDLPVTGPKERVYWVKKALQKAGIKKISYPIHLTRSHQISFNEIRYTT